MTTGIINQLEQTTEILEGASKDLRSKGVLDLFGSALQDYGDSESETDILALGLSLEDMQELYGSRYSTGVDALVDAICIGNGSPDRSRVRGCIDRYANTCAAEEFMGQMMCDIIACITESLPQCDVDELETAVMDIRDRLGYRKESIASELNALVHWEVDA